MYSIAQHAAAIIITSALGAFILCVLVIRYGFTPADDEPLPVRHRRFFVTRLGHAAGAVCFAITAGLAAVAMTVSSRPQVPPAPASTAAVDVTPLRAGQVRLTHDVRALDERIERTESALAELRSVVSATASRPAAPERAARPSRRAVARPSADDDARTTAVPPARARDGEGTDTMPRATSDFSAPQATATPESSRPDGVSARETFRFAAERIARLRAEIKEKAITARQALREFLREL